MQVKIVNHCVAAMCPSNVSPPVLWQWTQPHHAYTSTCQHVVFSHWGNKTLYSGSELYPRGSAQRPLLCGSGLHGLRLRSLTFLLIIVRRLAAVSEWKVLGRYVLFACAVVWSPDWESLRLLRHQRFTAPKTRARTSLWWAAQPRTSSRMCGSCWWRVQRTSMSVS